MKPHNKLFFVGVKAFILDVQGRLLIMQEPLTFAEGGKWELPGGKIAEGEEHLALEEILAREISEELGEGVQIKIGEMVCAFRRPWHKIANEVLLVGFRCNYKGGDIVLSHENSAYSWVTASDLNKYEFVQGYKKIISDFLIK